MAIGGGEGGGDQGGLCWGRRGGREGPRAGFIDRRDSMDGERRDGRAAACGE